MRKSVATIWILSILAVAVSGCSMFPGPDPAMRVCDSQLNRLEIQYLPGLGDPLVRLSILGSGYLRIQRGVSPLVTNDFSQNVICSQWGDIQVDQINLQPAEALMIFQTLVDRGLLREPDKAFQSTAQRGGATAIITGTLNNEAIARNAIEPELLGYIRHLITIFDATKATERTR